MDKVKSFKLNPEFCLIDKDFKTPKSVCVFDIWSLHHFFWQGLAYLLIHEFLKIKELKYSFLIFVILSFIHTIEEYLGNTSRISMEGIVIDNICPLLNTKIKPEKREIDNDYLDNSIGDVLSGMLSNLLIILYWYKFNKLPYFYLLGFLPIFLNLLSHAKRLY